MPQKTDVGDKVWKKILFLFAYLLTEFSDFKVVCDDNSVLFQIKTMQDLHGIYQNCHFFRIHATSQLTINIVNKQFYDEICSV